MDMNIISNLAFSPELSHLPCYRATVEKRNITDAGYNYQSENCQISIFFVQ